MLSSRTFSCHLCYKQSSLGAGRKNPFQNPCGLPSHMQTKTRAHVWFQSMAWQEQLAKLNHCVCVQLMLKKVQDVYRTDQRNSGLAPCSCRRSRKPRAALDGCKGSILCAVMGGDSVEPAPVAFRVAKLFRLLLKHLFCTMGENPCCCF